MLPDGVAEGTPITVVVGKQTLEMKAGDYLVKYPDEQWYEPMTPDEYEVFQGDVPAEGTMVVTVNADA